MSRKHLLGILTAASLLLSGVGVARGASNAEVRRKYQNAKKLYRAGRYEQAITAFKEIKVLRYHPILDYRIGQCYEALGQVQPAIVSFKLYIKYYGKFTPGKNHPSKKEVRARIARLQSGNIPPTTPPPDGGSGALPPSTKTDAGPAGASDQSGGGQTPPPGGMGPQHGSGQDEYPPPEPPKKMGYPRWKGLFFGADVATMGFSGGDLGNLSSYGVGGSLWAFYRPFEYLSGGLVGSISSLQSNKIYYSKRPTFAFAAVEVRGHLPLLSHRSRRYHQVEIWGGVFGGYANLKLDFDASNVDTITTNNLPTKYDVNGGVIGAVAGAEWYWVQWISLGMTFRVAKAFLPGDDAFDFAGKTATSWDGMGWDPAEGIDEGTLWYIGVSATFHLFLN
jgi:hypothetical protein